MQEEKQGGGKASLPIPTIHQNPHRPIIAAATHSSARQDKRGGSEERKRLTLKLPTPFPPRNIFQRAAEQERGAGERKRLTLKLPTPFPLRNPFRRSAEQERGSGERKRLARARLSPYQSSIKTESPLGKRRSGAKTRMGLSAEKREEPFAFLRLFSLVPADRSRVRLRPVRGTGTLPDAGGAGGGGHATRLPRPCDA